MLNFIGDHAGSLLVGLLVAAALWRAVRHLRRARRINGGCPHCCAGCPAACGRLRTPPDGAG